MMEGLLNLENLTEEERAVIYNVLRRDDRIRNAEDRKIVELKSEIQAIRMRSVLRNGDNLSKMCARCHTEFGIFKRGDVCSKCRFRVCNICRETLLNGKWLCSLCFKQRQLKWLQGDWETRKGNLQRWPSGADLVKASLMKTFTLAGESDTVDVEPDVKHNGSTVSNGSAHKEGAEVDRMVFPKESDKRKLTQLFDSFKMQPKPDKDDRQMSVKRVSSRRYSESSSSSEDDISSSLPPSVMTSSVRSSPAPSTGMDREYDIVSGLHSSDSLLNKSYPENVNSNKKSLQRKHSYDSDQTIHSDDPPFSKSSTETQIRVEVHSDNSSTKSLESCQPKTSPSSQTINRLKQSTEGASGGGVIVRKNSSSSQRSMSPDIVSQHKSASRQTVLQPGRSPSPYSFDSIPSSHANSPLPKQRLIDLAVDHSKHSSDTESLSRFSVTENSGTECHMRDGNSGADEFSVEELTKVRFQKLSKTGEKRSRSPHSPSRSPFPQLAAMDGENSGVGREGVKGDPHTPSDVVCDVLVMEGESDPELVDIEIVLPENSPQHFSAPGYMKPESEEQSYSSSDVGPESPPCSHPHAPPRNKKQKSNLAQGDIVVPPRKWKGLSKTGVILAPPRKNKTKMKKGVTEKISDEDPINTERQNKLQSAKPDTVLMPPPRHMKHRKQRMSDESVDDAITPKAPPRRNRKSSSESSGQESLSPEIAHQRRLIPYMAVENQTNSGPPIVPIRKHRKKNLSSDQSTLYRSKSDSAKYESIKDTQVSHEEHLSIKDAKRLFEQKGKEQLFGEGRNRFADNLEVLDSSHADADSSVLKQWKLSSYDQVMTESEGSFKLSPMTPLSPSKTNAKTDDYRFTYLSDSVFESPDIIQSDLPQESPFKSVVPEPQQNVIPASEEASVDTEFEELFNKAVIELQTSEMDQEIVENTSGNNAALPTEEEMIIELQLEENIPESDEQIRYSLSQEEGSASDYRFCTDDIDGQTNPSDIESLHKNLQDKKLWHFEEKSMTKDYRAAFGEDDNEFSQSRENVLNAMKAMSSDDSSCDLLSVIQEDIEPSEDGTLSVNSTSSVTLHTDTGDDADSVIEVKLPKAVQDKAMTSPVQQVESVQSQDSSDKIADDHVIHEKVVCVQMDEEENINDTNSTEVKCKGESDLENAKDLQHVGELEIVGAEMSPGNTGGLTDKEEVKTSSTDTSETIKEKMEDTCKATPESVEVTESKGTEHLQPDVLIKSKISSKKMVKQWLESEVNTSDSNIPIVSQDVNQEVLSTPSPGPVPATEPASSDPSQLHDTRIPTHNLTDTDTEKDIPAKLSPRASSEGSASLEDSGHVSGSSTQDNTPEHRRTDSTQSQTSVPSSVSTVTDKDDESEADIDELVASHKAHSFGSGYIYGNLQTPLSESKESIVSFYSDAGGVNYGKIPVTGEIQFGIDYNYRTGTLEISVRQCKDLAPADTRRNKSDPYVKTYLLPDKTRGGKRKTKVKRNTLSPVFDETLRYLISKSEVENRSLWVTVWHNDRFGRNDFLGEVTINFDYFRFGDSAPKWYPLQERVETQTTSLLTYRGDIILSLKYVLADQVTDIPTSPSKKKGRRGRSEGSKGQLHVHIKEARNLTAVRANGFSDPFLKGYLMPDKHRMMKQKTPVFKKNCNPKWNYTLVFDDVSLEELRERGLELTIWDYDKISSNDFLGGIRLNSGTGRSFGKIVDWMDAKGEEISMWQAMLDRPGAWIDGTLILRPNMDKRKY